MSAYADHPDRESRIRALFPLVKKIARRLRVLVPGADLDDLVGDGSIGLIRAVDRFDPQRGPSLEHYARRLILGAMLNGIRRMDPVSERSRRAARDGENLRYQMAMERGNLPTLNEVERAKPGFLHASAIAREASPLSLDIALPEGESLALDWSGDPADVYDRRCKRAEFEAMVDALAERPRRLIREHYYAEASLREVGRRMGFSSQRASQIHVTAIARLRAMMHAAPR
ncbi:MAG TPA: sigma-70 family RNA polymerase sigma factor [Candidatus Baltobacteraceae bacterium]|nr:sigma-70 family RNA polymerase sigma factor [Candidatus Baltobacteraceae bacterium]